MKDYLFVFGRDFELSLMEFDFYCKARGIKYQIIEKRENIVVISIDWDIKKLVNELGGLVKVGEIVKIKDKNEITKYLENEITKFGEDKIRYGISVYFNSSLNEFVSDSIRNIFKEFKIKGILLNERKGNELNPSKIVKTSLIEEGFDLMLFKNYFARTIAVSNPLEYKFRDKRPRNDFVKSISIRLAKILINLSGVKEKDTLLDPFCGVGVLLQEALLMNINVIGIDKERKSIKDSYENIDWLKKNYKFNASFKLLNGDARRLRNILKEKIDVVVTEPYLGPYLKKIPTREQALKIKEELELLYNEVFYNLKGLVKKNIVFIIPRFRLYEGDRVRLNFERILDKNGFKIVNSEFKIPIIYTAKGNKFEREIWIVNNR